MIKLYNTLKRKKEEFSPSKETVEIYTCGPTVYEYAHIGNLRAYIFEDILKRTLVYNNYNVKHVMNITDVGHLTSDEDTGDDKVEASAKKKKKTAKEIIDYYTAVFKKDIAELNILNPDLFIKASETIKEQQDVIKILEKKSFTYIIDDGVYFDTSKLKNYGELAMLDKVSLKPGARVAVGEKKNETDFALWKFSPKDGGRQMEWDSPWGIGFPGWHTECVAMAKMHFDFPFDIHCGGVDHICVHHTNEIAQSEAAYGKNPAKIWMHCEFVVGKDGKMSKSKGEITTLELLEKKAYHPLSLRYLALNAHYRSKLEFSYEALSNAQNSLQKMKMKVQELRSEKKEVSSLYKEKFKKAINDDLNTPQALAVAWNVLKDQNLKKEEKYNLLIDFDRVFGLNLEEEQKIPENIKEMAKEREMARRKKDFEKADEIRKEIESLGYTVEDTEKECKIKKIN